MNIDDINDIKVGDMLFCKQSFIGCAGYDYTVGYYSVRDLEAGSKESDNFLVHLYQGKQYRIEQIIGSKVCVINEFGKGFYYDINIFGKIKEMRKLKLEKLEKYESAQG
jgi:hypothetical protein